MAMRVALYQPLIGRSGNQMFQYAYAKSMSERTGLELVTPDWAGDRIFDLEPSVQTSNDHLVQLPESYHQDQDSLIYTRSQARAWFKFRPEVQARYDSLPAREFVSHRRVGDYPALGYPVVSRASYDRAIKRFDLYGVPELKLGEEHPDFILDFMQMMKARVLFRGNSSFSWWAATLGDPITYSPVINHHNAGEHDFQFVKGNHPALSVLPCCTELRLRE